MILYTVKSSWANKVIFYFNRHTDDTDLKDLRRLKNKETELLSKKQNLHYTALGLCLIF
jgi:hypothetical protein